ncbi:MAG TPA: hypothetical protein VGM78_02065, partial [Ilumatobacteraceae bacterium]
QVARVGGLRTTLSVYRYGSHDPTTRLGGNDFWRATLTPDGPATLHIHWSPAAGADDAVDAVDTDGLDAEAWGPGAAWMLDRVAAMTGAFDTGGTFADDSHPAILRARRNHPGLRLGASGTLYHELLPVIIAQRVTGGEAIMQWRRLAEQLGERAPGPDSSLRLPPSPASIVGHPAWWYHPRGVEAKRAEALRIVARYANRIAEWSCLPAHEAADKLALLRGIGPWTIGSVLGPSHGDPDAVPVGDYHVPNMVAWALAGEPRGTDARMLELLAPYHGQRGRVIRLLGMDGHAAPAFGPRQRIQPMYRW